MSKERKKARAIRCAIYTRKSSDEGLDQSFNSLDAQREAGEAYVKSQSCEGWKMIPTLYDDGGYSGGTMERPALGQLLGDVDAGLVDVVVVYKIDRLTRSLPDFARIVERFDAQKVSFVSVTQAFNTTSSGRLTLNVLLSFAQFEREVTGERIRDKIAASKAKGMWMGGNVPLGYDRPATGTRMLRVNDTEAAAVRHIFTRYLELGSVHHLQRELAEQGVRSKRRVTGSGKVIGGTPFSRGALFHLLRNQLYRGMITHKGEVYEGKHDAIIDAGLFERVQQHLDGNARRHRAASDHRVAKAPLMGKLFDDSGEVMSPTFSRGRSGRTYRYYVSASLQQGTPVAGNGPVKRLPAPMIERVIAEAVTRWTRSAEPSLDRVLGVRLGETGLAIDLPGNCAADIAGELADGERLLHATKKICRVHLPLALPLRGGRRLIIAGTRATAQPDAILISALRRAHRMLERDRRGLPVMEAAPASPYQRRLMRLAFLAPDIQRDILAGDQPPQLNLERLIKTPIPLSWSKQRAALGWHATERPCSSD